MPTVHRRTLLTAVAATDVEDAPKGFGPLGDKESLLEGELHRFAQVRWEIVNALASRQ